MANAFRCLYAARLSFRDLRELDVAGGKRRLQTPVPDHFNPPPLNRGGSPKLLLLFAQMLALVANSALSFQATGLVSSTGRSGVVMQVGQPLELSGSLLG